MTWVLGIRNTVIQAFIDWGCVRTEGTRICFNRGQSKWQEAVESCIMRSCVISIVCKVLGKSKQGIHNGWVTWLASETRKTHTKFNWRMWSEQLFKRSVLWVNDGIIVNAFYKVGLEGLDCICGAWEDWVVCYFEHCDEVWSSLKFRSILDYMIGHCSPQKDCIVSGIILTYYITVL